MTVEFEEDNEYGYKNTPAGFLQKNQEPPKGLLSIFISMGIVKNHNQAKIIAVILTILFFGMSIYFFMN